jgi:hypothetical protein
VACISTYPRYQRNRKLRSRSVHAACIAVSPHTIVDRFSVWTADNGWPVIDADQYTVEAAGITVPTILGLKEITSMGDAPCDDEATVAVFVPKAPMDFFSFRQKA